MSIHIFPVQSAQPPAAEIVAQTLVDGVNAGLESRVSQMKNLWETLWENPRATPAEVLLALGTNAGKLFLAAVKARADLIEMATLAGTTAEQLLGDSKYLSPKFPVTVHANGTVTLN
jgi:hypothetical protein